MYQLCLQEDYLAAAESLVGRYPYVNSMLEGKDDKPNQQQPLWTFEDYTKNRTRDTKSTQEQDLRKTSGVIPTLKVDLPRTAFIYDPNGVSLGSEINVAESMQKMPNVWIEHQVPPRLAYAQGDLTGSPAARLILSGFKERLINDNSLLVTFATTSASIEFGYYDNNKKSMIGVTITYLKALPSCWAINIIENTTAPKIATNGSQGPKVSVFISEEFAKLSNSNQDPKQTLIPAVNIQGELSKIITAQPIQDVLKNLIQEGTVNDAIAESFHDFTTKTFATNNPTQNSLDRVEFKPLDSAQILAKQSTILQQDPQQLVLRFRKCYEDFILTIYNCYTTIVTEPAAVEIGNNLYFLLKQIQSPELMKACLIVLPAFKKYLEVSTTSLPKFYDLYSVLFESVYTQKLASIRPDDPEVIELKTITDTLFDHLSDYTEKDIEKFSTSIRAIRERLESYYFGSGKAMFWAGLAIGALGALGGGAILALAFLNIILIAAPPIIASIAGVGALLLIGLVLFIVGLQKGFNGAAIHTLQSAIKNTNQEESTKPESIPLPLPPNKPRQKQPPAAHDPSASDDISNSDDEKTSSTITSSSSDVTSFDDK
jgi:hypothetical protein